VADFERDGASFFARLSKRLTEERRKYAGPATFYYRCPRCGRTDAYVADVGRMMKLRCERPVGDPSESETGRYKCASLMKLVLRRRLLRSPAPEPRQP